MACVSPAVPRNVSGLPVVIEKSLVLPVSAAELEGGRRQIKLVLDVTIDPQG